MRQPNDPFVNKLETLKRISSIDLCLEEPIFSKCNYTINDDGSIDILDSVTWYNRFTIKDSMVETAYEKFEDFLPVYVGMHHCTNFLVFPQKINRVHGDFNIDMNLLVSMKNFPDIIDGSFSAAHNRISSLHYFPKQILANIDIGDNPINLFKGIPKVINGNFDIRYTNLMSKDFAHIPKVKGILNILDEDYRLLSNDDQSYLVEHYNVNLELVTDGI